MNLAKTERAALADLFLTLGPDQPTLCEGWDTQDLLIHLLVRENNPAGAIGQRVSLLHGAAEKAEADYAKRPWTELVEKYRSGPPGWNPTSWGKLDDLTNGGEMFIHHEDARRGQVGWEPRHLDAAATTELTKMVASGMSRLGLRRSPVGVVAVMPGSEPVTLKSGEPAVTITGEPGELILWISGRDACKVDFDGDAGAIGTVTSLKRGF
jgi:uncharacterized protein (TIGR03085 family)